MGWVFLTTLRAVIEIALHDAVKLLELKGANPWRLEFRPWKKTSEQQNHRGTQQSPGDTLPDSSERFRRGRGWELGFLQACPVVIQKMKSQQFLVPGGVSGWPHSFG